MSKKKNKVISTSSDWSIEVLYKFNKEISRIAKDYLKLDTYPNIFEIVTADQLIHRMSLVGLPASYDHWSFGKDYMTTANGYTRGQMGLSYEMVINSNPCLSYNIEENTTCLMALVMAHAAYGHNAFFKGNHLFKMWTNADAILDYMEFAKKYIEDCEQKYGYEEVEAVLDACHALRNYGVDKYKHPPRLSTEEEAKRRKQMEEDEHKFINEIWKTIPDYKLKKDAPTEFKFPKDPQENILYFLEKNTPNLENWKRELIRIVRKIAQYFYPQAQTKVSNEGFACFVHYHIIYKMYEEGLVDDGFMLEFLDHHTAVVAQPGHESRYYYGFNPYALGFNIYQDIKRICEDPTEEDKQWFPQLIGKNWLEEVDYAMRNFKDESFIMQYLSPKVIRDMRLFSIADNEEDRYYQIDSIHNDAGYKAIRETLAAQYQRDRYVPDIQIESVDVYGDRRMRLIYTPYREMNLDDHDAKDVARHLNFLWGFPVEVYHRFEDGELEHICDSD